MIYDERKNLLNSDSVQNLREYDMLTFTYSVMIYLYGYPE